MIDVDSIIATGQKVVYSQDARDKCFSIESEFVGYSNKDCLSKGWGRFVREPRTYLIFNEYIDYIYALIDPITKEICYVGKTNNPQSRYAQHTSNPENWTGNGGKSVWVDSLNQINELPVMYVLDCYSIWGDGASEIEKQYVQKFWDEGQPLLNRSQAKGRKKSEAWQERINNCRWVVGRRGNAPMLDSRKGVIS